MMSLLRNLALLLANPLMLALIIALFALALRLLRCPRSALLGAVLATLVGWLGSTPVFGDELLAPLERQYPRLDPQVPLSLHDVVVLGSGYDPGGQRTPADALDDEGLRRVLEALRWSRRLGARLILSGGAPDARDAPALGYERFVREQQDGACDCVLLPRALDTTAESREIRNLLGDRPFLLVTSASHMPRAMRNMADRGLHAVPAPTAFMSELSRDLRWRRWLPSAAGLRRSERALHEYFGLVAMRLGGEVRS